MYAALGHYAGVLIFASSLPLAAFAFVRGSFAERSAALALLAAWALSGLVEGGGRHTPLNWVISIPVLAIEFGLSMVFLALALRYGSIWLGCAMIAQGAQLGLHAFYISGEGHAWRTFALASNLISVLQLALLLAAILTTWRRRARTEPLATAPA